MKTYHVLSRQLARYGGVSDMTLWRWLRNPALDFPEPLVINGRRLWELTQLEKWERVQVRASGENSR